MSPLDDTLMASALPVVFFFVQGMQQAAFALLYCRLRVTLYGFSLSQNGFGADGGGFRRLGLQSLGHNIHEMYPGTTW